MFNEIANEVSVMSIRGVFDFKNLFRWLTTKKEDTALETKIKDGGNNTTQLIIAARDGHLDRVKFLLRCKADIEARGTLKVNDAVFTGCTPLWAATAVCHEDFGVSRFS